MAEPSKTLSDKIARNVVARKLGNEIVEMGITLAKEEGLSEYPESVRRMWGHVIEIAGDLIGEPQEVEDPATPPFKIESQNVVATSNNCPEDDEEFPFGKYKGQCYGQIPDSYYKWLAKQPWIEQWPDVFEYIQANNLD